ncbi:MAG: DUF748 domain-containing protein [Bacteroidales bacterium]
MKKILLIIIGIIIIIGVIIILSASFITKYLVEKYSVKYTGRVITMDWAYTNPFTGFVHFSDFKMYEFKSDSVFFSANNVSFNIALLELFSKDYKISELTLDHPRIIVSQNKKDFNFNDMIEKFSSKKNSDTTKEPVHFSILNIKINDGEFYYREKQIPINYFIKNLYIESPGIRWDADTIAAKYSFLSGIGSGDMKGYFSMNLKTYDYRLTDVVHKFDLKIINQYIKAMVNYGNFSASLDANIRANGNFHDAGNINIKGMLAINDFHVGKNITDDYAAFKKLSVIIIELSPNSKKYLFDSVSLSYPYLKYERYDYLDNMEMMFGKGGATIAAANNNSAPFNLVLEIGDYIKALSKNFFNSDYNINRITINNGELKFNDYSISEKFTMDFKPVSVFADSIDKNHKRVSAIFNSGIYPYGNVSVALSINPKDSGDFDMQYNLHKLSLTMFNPYIINYTSFPLDRGTMEFNGTWHVRNSIIQSENHLVIIDPRLTKRLKNKDTKWIPMPLIMSFIRETGNVIDYEIPISGNLKDPKFHLYNVLIDLLENIFLKPSSTSYIVHVKNIENDIEKSLTVKWEMRNNSLLPDQEKFIKRMTDFLVKNPAASITVYPQQYEVKEKEYILFYEAKKKYFLLTNNKNTQSFSRADSIKVDKMSVKDSLFVLYLNKRTYGLMLFTIQEKCWMTIGSAIINNKFNQLTSERANAFIMYFEEKGVGKQVNILAGQNVIPYNGFSFYKIVYHGEFPESLIKAYQKMNDLNDDELRNRYEVERKNIPL